MVERSTKKSRKVKNFPEVNENESTVQHTAGLVGAVVLASA